MPIAHVTCYYAALLEVYLEASAIGFTCGHIAEFYLERWWTAFASEAS